MNKGERTRLSILEQSFKYSSQYGIADITIGSIAKLCNMSRTGVISHFDNKEDMQLAILKYGEDLYIENVIHPARQSDPLAHLKHLLSLWADWTNEIYTEPHLNCPFIKAIVEFQNRPPSTVRTFILEQQSRLIDYLKHRVNRCVEHGCITTDVPSFDIAYELYSLYLGHAITQNNGILKVSNDTFRRSVDRLLKQYQA